MEQRPQPSPYLAYYGLQREPFGQTIEDDLYFADATRKQRLDILLHLTQYGNELMLVLGQEGSGKTTLLRQFQLKALPSWSIALINAKNGLDERLLMQQLFHQMGMNFNGPTHAELTEQMTHHFDSLLRSARQAVMIIDDAEHLTVTALKRILEMAALTNKEHKPLLRVILAGNPDLTDKLNDPLLAQFNSIPQRSIELSPFDQENTAHYILHRLSAAHFSATEPFTDANLHKLYKQSGGLPGRINEQAHKLFMDSLPVKAQSGIEGIESIPTFKPLRTLLTAVASIIILALIIFQDEINQWFHPQQTVTTDLAIPAPDNEASSAPSANENTQPATTVPEAQATTPFATEENITAEKPPAAQPPVTLETTMDAIVASGLEQEPATEKPQTEENPQDSAVAMASPDEGNVATTTNATTDATPDKAQIKPEVTQTPKPAARPKDLQTSSTTGITPLKKAASKPEVSKASATATDTAMQLPNRREDWLRQQDPAHYTLQLVAGENLDTIRKFIREHRLVNDDLALYQTTRNGKPWYGLTYGIYPNKQKAIDARSQLAPHLRKLTPWVREFGNIQTALP